MKSPNQYVVDIIPLLSDLIGSKLATIKVNGEVRPAIFPARSKNPRNLFPYITVDHLNAIPTSDRIINTYVGYTSGR